MKAVYYNEILQPKTFDVLKKNEDGTVDIGNGTTLVVGKVKVTDEPAAGCVTLGATSEKTETVSTGAKSEEPAVKTKTK